MTLALIALIIAICGYSVGYWHGRMNAVAHTNLTLDELRRHLDQ